MHRAARRLFPSLAVTSPRSPAGWIASAVLVVNASSTPSLPARAAAPEDTVAPALGLPGTGWLGMKVGDSTEPGRWIITELAADGPAAVGGMHVGDEIRGMNGRELASLDEVAQALTAVAAGQRVPIAAAREGRPLDIVLVAQPRPARPATVPPAAGGPGAGVSPASGTDSGDRYPHMVPRSRFGGDADAPALPEDPARPFTPVRPSPAAAPRPFVDATRERTFGTPQPAGPDAWAAAGQPGPTVAPSAVAPPLREPATFPGMSPVVGTRSRGRTALGVRTVPIDGPTQARFRLPRPSGAYVIGVVGELPAWKAGVPAGSVIVALGERPVNSPEELTQMVAGGPTDRPLPIHYVLPGGEQKRAEVVLQSLDVPLERALVGGDTAAGNQPTPRRAERPVSPADATEVRMLRDEIRQVRERMDWLERRLGGLEPRTP